MTTACVTTTGKTPRSVEAVERVADQPGGRLAVAHGGPDALVVAPGQ